MQVREKCAGLVQNDFWLQPCQPIPTLWSDSF